MAFTIRTKLFIAFLIMLAPLIALIIIQYYNQNILCRGIYRIETLARNFEAVSNLHLALERTVIPPNDYLITGDPAERGRFEALAADVEKQFDALIQSEVEVEEEVALARSAREQFQALKGTAEKILAIKEPVGSKEGAGLMLRLDAAAHKIVENYMEKHHDLDKRKFDESLETSERARRRSWIIMIGGSLVLVAFGFLFAFSYSKLCVRPIKILRSGAEVIGAGDFDCHLDIHTGDEIEQLADEFNSMGDKLKGFYDKVRERTASLEKALKDATNAKKEVLSLYEEALELSKKELEGRVEELERFRKATIGREFRVKELRERIAELEKEVESKKR
ncbi:MAG: HAMP domain-containing protein [Thermodesulfobacteriota bacterium]